MYSTEFKWTEKITATETQPHRTVLEYFAIFKNIAHSLEPGETPGNSASHQAPNYLQRSDISQNMINNAKNTSYRNRNATAPEPELSRLKINLL